MALTDRRDAARESFSVCDWPAAYDGFVATEDDRLTPQDWESLAEAAWWVGHVDRALSAYPRAVHGFEARGDLPRAGMAALLMGVHAAERGEQSLGSGWVSRAHRLLEECGDCAEKAYPSYFAAFDAMGRGDLDAADDHGTALLRAGRTFADPNLVALGVLVHGRVLVKRHRIREGLVLLDETLAAAQSDELHPRWAGTLFCHLMDVCRELNDIERSSEWTVAAAQWCESFPAATLFRGICSVHRSQLLTTQGAWLEAEQEAQRAREGLTGMHVAVLAEAYYQVGELRRLRGDSEAAMSSYAAADRHGRTPEPGLALLQLESGRTERAGPAIAAMLCDVTDPLARFPLLLAQVDIGIALDDLDTAGVAAAELDSIATEFGTSGIRAGALRSRGALTLAQGEAARALSPLRGAFRILRAGGALHEAGSVRLLIADALMELGDESGARREAMQACAAFESLGATPALHRARRVIRRTGAHPAGLTPRECEVLALVADGLTNRQVARQLDVSEKTVSHHLEHVYAKLGVGSRAAATAFALEHGL